MATMRIRAQASPIAPGPLADSLARQPGGVSQSGSGMPGDDARLDGRLRLGAPRRLVGFVAAQKIEPAVSFVDRSLHGANHSQPTWIILASLGLQTRLVVINRLAANQSVL